MTLTSLLYISRSRIDPVTAEAVVKEIVTAAIVSNKRRSLTGALLFTGTHFAQVIEGSDEDVDGLFATLGRDDRHDELVVVNRAPLIERRFENWSMGYFGPSQFVARHVTRLLNDPSPAEKHRAAGWLTELMVEFTRS